MLFEWGQGVGRELVNRMGLGEFGEEANAVLMGMGGNLSIQGQQSLAAIDPITQIPFGSRQIFPAGTSIPLIPIGAIARVLTYVVPVGFTAVVNALQIVYTGGSFVSGSGEFLYRVKVDGRAIDTLANITTNIGTINTTEQIAPFKVNSGQTVTIEVEHVANAALGSAVNGRIGGYIFPKTR